MALGHTRRVRKLHRATFRKLHTLGSSPSVSFESWQLEEMFGVKDRTWTIEIDDLVDELAAPE